MKIRKGDKVVVIKGKDRAKTGSVLRVFTKENKVVVEDANFVKKRMRPTKKGEKGKTVKVPAPIPVSNVKVICPDCKKGVRVGYQKKEGEKKRVCAVCGKEL